MLLCLWILFFARATDARLCSEEDEVLWFQVMSLNGLEPGYSSGDMLEFREHGTVYSVWMQTSVSVSVDVCSRVSAFLLRLFDARHTCIIKMYWLKRLTCFFCSSFSSWIASQE
eukprot:m.64848 g.64848  ORF g.64848 m.64848 type:complete len:114 (-) comp12031_c1_seq1:52-393(-)